MFLSIIIPVYNVEPYLRECLDSVFSQNLTDCEVIAVNDGSTDGSRAILKEYKENQPDIFTIVDKTNGGLSSARNTGVEHATGDYLYFLDSDDFLKPHAVASIRKAVADSENADVIYLDCIETDRGRRLGTHEVKVVPIMTFRAFSLYAYEHSISIAPNVVSFVYSSSYWGKCDLRFEEGIKYEDALFKYQLFMREDGTIKALHLEEPFYVYRIGREGSISTKMTLKNLTDKQRVRKMTDRLWKENGIVGAAFYHMLYDASVYMLYEAYESGLINQHCMFWDREDVRIMRRGVTNGREYGLWFLAKMSPRWMACYYANDLPNWKRRLTNLMLTILIKPTFRWVS